MNDLKVLATSLAVSLAVNGTLIYSFERAALWNARQAELVKLAAQNKNRLEFEFVEAPAKVRPEMPRKTKRISSRDALNQGQKAAPESTMSGIEQKGPADQLRQKRGSGGAEPSPKVDLAKASVKSEPSPQNKETKVEMPEKAKDATSMAAPVEAPVEKPKPRETREDIHMLAEPRPKSDERMPQQPVKPNPAAPGVTGQDKVDTAQMAKTTSVSAQFFGITSFETTGSGMGEYMKGLKEKVWLSWYPYLSFHYPMDQRSADVVLSVRLNKFGDVKAVRILDSYGEPLFATYCMEAIQRAGNFGKLPDEILALLKDEELEIKFGFHYR